MGVQQALRDGVALDRLQRAEEAAAEGPGLGGRSCGWIIPVRRCRTTWRMVWKTCSTLPGQLERINICSTWREGQLALVAEPRDEEGRELLDVLDMVTQRRTSTVLGKSRSRRARSLLCAPGPSVTATQTARLPSTLWAPAGG